jgi:hypothetical protein
MPADASLDALSQFRAEVGDALRRLDAPAAFRKPTSNPESA